MAAINITAEFLNNEHYEVYDCRHYTWVYASKLTFRAGAGKAAPILLFPSNSIVDILLGRIMSINSWYDLNNKFTILLSESNKVKMEELDI